MLHRRFSNADVDEDDEDDDDDAGALAAVFTAGG
jgi:hypothetical protein